MTSKRTLFGHRAFRRLVLPALAFCIVGLNSCDDDEGPTGPTGSAKAETYNSAMVQAWMDLMLTMTKESSGYTPPVASRTFGYAGLALYESIVSGMTGFQSLAGEAGKGGPGGALPVVPTVESGKEYHWPTVANNAIAAMLTAMYVFDGNKVDNAPRIANLQTQFNQQYQSALSAEVYNRSKAYGESVAAHIYTWSQSDGGHEGFKKNFPGTWTPPVGDGYWEPTPPGFQSALQPYWGDNRTFAPGSVSNTQPGPPPAFSLDTESQFYLEALEVYEVSQNLTEETRTIAKFWSDDPGTTATPPGHSLSILRQVLAMENANLALATEAFAKLGMGVSDAFVSCWKSKYTYNLVRPVTCLQRDFGHSDWLPIVGTPPFPEYTSGHSVQSGAMAGVLNSLFGTSYAFTDRTHEHRTDIDGSPRAFASFDAAADEAAISRLYGGIHYRAAIDLGVYQGYEVATEVLALPYKP